MPGYHLLPATRADLLRRLGRFAEAASEYRTALSLVKSEVEKRYLAARLEEPDWSDDAAVVSTSSSCNACWLRNPSTRRRSGR